MASGSFGLTRTGDTSRYANFTVNWSSYSNGSANNSSTFNVDVYVSKASNSTADTYGDHTTTVSVSGGGTKSSSGSFRVKPNSSTLLFRDSFTIGHNSDGTKKTSVSVDIGGNVIWANGSSGEITLDTIPRASTPSYEKVVAMGERMKIYTNRASSNFTHTLSYHFGNATGTIATGVGGEYYWTVPYDLAYQIPDAVRGTGTIYCKTYQGSTYIGEKSCSFTVTTHPDMKPVVNVSYQEATEDMIAKGWNIYVKSISQLAVTVSGEGVYGSTIKKYSTIVDGFSYSNNTFTTLPLQNSGSVSVKATVEDSRGIQASPVNSSFPVADYFKPTITSASVFRCNDEGLEDGEGTYLLYSIAAQIAPVSNKNQALYYIHIKPKDSEEDYAKYFIGNSYDIAHTNIVLVDSNTGDKVQLSTDVSYSIRVEARDSFESTFIDKEIGTGFDLINLNESGNSMALGKISEAKPEERILEIGFEETRISGDITMTDGRSIVLDKHTRYTNMAAFLEELYQSDARTGSLYLQEDYILADFGVSVYSSFYTYTWIPLRTFPIEGDIQNKPYTGGTLVLYESTGALNPITITLFNKGVIMAQQIPSANFEPILRGEYPILVEPFSFYTAYESKDIQTIYNLKGQLLALYPEKPGYKRTYRLQAIVNSGNNDVELYLAGQKVMTFSIWGSNSARDGRMHFADVTHIINSIDTGHKTLGVYMNSDTSTFVHIQYVGIQVFDEMETAGGVVQVPVPSDRKILWEGALVGGSTIVLSGWKRFLDIYVRINFDNRDGSFKYTLDTSMDEPSYAGGCLTPFDEATVNSLYMSECQFKKSTGELLHKRIGYYIFSTNVWEDRNNREGGYVITRVETYD